MANAKEHEITVKSFLMIGIFASLIGGAIFGTRALQTGSFSPSGQTRAYAKMAKTKEIKSGLMREIFAHEGLADTNVDGSKGHISFTEEAIAYRNMGFTQPFYETRSVSQFPRNLSLEQLAWGKAGFLARLDPDSFDRRQPNYNFEARKKELYSREMTAINGAILRAGDIAVNPN